MAIDVDAAVAQSRQQPSATPPPRPPPGPLRQPQLNMFRQPEMPPPPPAMMHAPNPADANDTHILRHQFDRFNATAADAAQQPAAQLLAQRCSAPRLPSIRPTNHSGARWSRYWKDSHDDAARCAPGQRWWRRAESSCSPSPTERLPSSRNASAQPFLLCPMASPSGPLRTPSTRSRSVGLGCTGSCSTSVAIRSR